MSYGLNPYIMDHELMHSVIEPSDDKLLYAMKQRFSKPFATDSEYFPFNGEYSFQYGYAFEPIYQYYASWLNNNYFALFQGWV